MFALWTDAMCRRLLSELFEQRGQKRIAPPGFQVVLDGKVDIACSS
jgi:hypothetical protein